MSIRATNHELAISMLCRYDATTEKVVTEKVVTAKTAKGRRRWLEVQKHIKRLRTTPEWYRVGSTSTGVNIV